MDGMEQPYCCLDCSAKFAFGELTTVKPKTGSLSQFGVYCPNCNGPNIHPADGTEREIDEYHGEVGTLN
jgi:hypothetical protein